MCRLWRLGWGGKRIGRHLGIHCSTTHRHIRRAAGTFYKRRWALKLSDEQQKMLVDLTKQGYKKQTIAEQLDIGLTSVYRYQKRLGCRTISQFLVPHGSRTDAFDEQGNLKCSNGRWLAKNMVDRISFLTKEGHNQDSIAEKVGCSRSSVSRWQTRLGIQGYRYLNPPENS